MSEGDFDLLSQMTAGKFKEIDRRLAALEAGLSRREPIAGGDYGRGAIMSTEKLREMVRSIKEENPRVFPRDPPPNTRGDGATGYARQEHRRVTLRKTATTITVTGSEGVIRSLELDGWLPA